MKKFVILSNNFVSRKDLFAEHGLSIYIKFNNISILFDAGQSDIFLKNSRFMNIDLQNSDFTVISHNHYDHAGGLEYLNNMKGELLIPPNFEKEIYQKRGQNLKKISASLDMKNVTLNFLKTSVVEKTITIAEDIHLIRTDAKDKETPEISILVSNTLFTGCSHSGILNILEKAKEINPQTDTIAGGFHTRSDSNSELAKIAEKLKKNNIKKIYPMHCSGIEILKELAAQQIDYSYPSVGNMFEIS